MKWLLYQFQLQQMASCNCITLIPPWVGSSIYISNFLSSSLILRFIINMKGSKRCRFVVIIQTMILQLSLGLIRYSGSSLNKNNREAAIGGFISDKRPLRGLIRDFTYLWGRIIKTKTSSTHLTHIYIEENYSKSFLHTYFLFMNNFWLWIWALIK